MRLAVIVPLLLGGALTLAAPVAAQSSATFVGVKGCTLCHKTEKQGNQLAAWEKSQHSKAYVTLTTAAANDIATKQGLGKPAAEAAECLECHTMKGATDPAAPLKDGVQCEVCHGAGSAYKTLSVMRDHAKSVAAGMTEYKDKAAIEAKCRTCHNDRSPSFKGFAFDEAWQKIAHPVPKAP